MTQGTELVKTESALSERQTALGINPEYIKAQERQIALLRQLTKNVLKRGRDYGRTPGIPTDYLWDPGASTIIGAFNCHSGQRRILSLKDDGQIIAAVIEVPLIHFETGQELGSGIGASSTQETKHKYRWVEDPTEWGFNTDAIKTLKTRIDNGRTKYRIPNPEHGELLNTIVKIASKRAEVDAAEGLPGVGSALRELFDTQGQQQARPEPDWAAFWARIAQMGIGEDDVHRLLNVKSVREWINQNKTLEEAVKVIAKGLADVGETQFEDTETPPEQPEETNHPNIDLTWLKESLEEIKWTEDTARSWIIGHFQILQAPTKFIELLNMLTQDQAQEFCNEIQSRIAKTQKQLFE